MTSYIVQTTAIPVSSHPIGLLPIAAEPREARPIPLLSDDSELVVVEKELTSVSLLLAERLVGVS